MKRALIDDSLWFIHKDGGRLYPWLRYSKHHGFSSFWVSDGSNLIEDAVPVATISELVVQVFSRRRSVWLSDNGKRTGLHRFGHDVIHDWGPQRRSRPWPCGPGIARGAMQLYEALRVLHSLQTHLRSASTRSTACCWPRIWMPCSTVG